MNWQTPYGDPLITTLLTAAAHTLACCAVALTVAMLTGGIVAVVWRECGSLVAHLIRMLVGIMDAMGLVLPSLAVLSALQIKSEWTVSVVLGIMTWNVVAAFLKEETDALSRSGFVQASVAIGAPAHRIMLRHIIPHIAARIPSLVLALVAGYVGLLGALGFLGVAGDAQHSLGFMVFDAKSFVRQNPAYFAGALISFLTLMFVPHLLARLIGGKSSDRFNQRSRLA